MYILRSKIVGIIKSFRGAFFLAIVATTVASLWPGNQIYPGFAIKDKLIHFSAWLMIAWFATSAFALKSKARWMVLGLIAWSFAIEIAQLFVPFRAFEWEDLLANSAGVVSGVLLARVVRHLPLITQK